MDIENKLFSRSKKIFFNNQLVISLKTTKMLVLITSGLRITVHQNTSVNIL